MMSENLFSNRKIFVSEHSAPVPLASERQRAHTFPQRAPHSHESGASWRRSLRIFFFSLIAHWNFFRRYWRWPKSEKAIIYLLMRLLFVVVLLCFVLLGLSTYLVLYGNDTHRVDVSSVSGGEEIIMHIWRLYDMAARTDEMYYKKELRDYIIAVKNALAHKRGKFFEVEMGKGLPSGGISRTHSLTALQDMLFRLHSVLGTIEEHMPEDGMRQAAAFVEEKYLSESEELSPKQRTLLECESEKDIMTDIADYEEEVFEPVDELALLQLKEYIRRHESGIYAASSPLELSVADAKKNLCRLLFTASSVHGGKFFYSSRRHARAQPYAKETPETNAAWYDALRLHYAEQFGLNEEEEYVVPRMEEEYIKAVEPHVGNRLSKENTATIFVGIASYRDVECKPTIDHMRRRAANFFRIYFGVAEQHQAEEPSCANSDFVDPFPCASSKDMEGGVCYPMDNIRIRKIRPSSSKGPTYGRYMSMLLYNGEDFSMIVDSHTRVVFAWDTRMMKLYMDMKHPKMVLSHYPLSFNDKEDFDYEQKNTAYLCGGKFLPAMGYIRLSGALISNINGYDKNFAYVKPYEIRSLNLDPEVKRRLPQPWAAAGFMFSSGSIYREVPFDPHLPGIFDGEEILYSVRLWTHGYDIHSPIAPLCYHIYDRIKAPKVWFDSKDFYRTQAQSRKRVQYYLRTRIKGTDTLIVPRYSKLGSVTVDIDRYGMGRMRSVDEWYDFAGADPINYTIYKKWCNL